MHTHKHTQHAHTHTHDEEVEGRKGIWELVRRERRVKEREEGICTHFIIFCLIRLSPSPTNICQDGSHHPYFDSLT